MERIKLQQTFFLLIPIVVLAFIVSCSEEIVPITRQDRSALDSLEQEIAILGNDLSAAEIARDSLERYRNELQEIFKELEAQTADSVFADVHYTIQVIDGSAAYSNVRIASLSGAVVSISQGNVFQEVTTDNTGFATFPALDNGFVSVTVEIAGYSDVFLVVDLGGSASGDSRNVSTQVMVFPTTGSNMFTLSGTSYYNQDLNNLRTDSSTDPSHPYQGLQIYETVPEGTRFLIDCRPTTIPNNIPSTPGFVVSAVYAGLQRVGTSDVDGNWTVTIPVVLLSNGNNLFDYTGPKNGDKIKGTRISVSPNPNTTEIWSPFNLFPLSLGEIPIFPGGNSIQDLYYEPSN